VAAADRQQAGSGPGLPGSVPPKFLGGQARAGRQGPSSRPSSSPPSSAAALGAGIPPNLWARCNYCNASLPLSRLMRQEGIANSWLSRQKPVLSCCPQCKKPLPRCAVCLLSMGCLNPYIELQRERGAYSRGGGAGKQLQQQQQGAEDLSGLASVPFSDWWSWCLKCKHGGHAHHLNSWFEKHSTCPVSGCDCRCQADIGVCVPCDQ